MKLLVDMHISPKSVIHLRELGHDAVHLRERGMQRASDSEVLSLAHQEDRVVLTMDLGFGQLLALSGARAPGVVILRLETPRPEKVNTYLTELLSTVADEELRGSVTVVEEGRVRIRRLPIA